MTNLATVTRNSPSNKNDRSLFTLAPAGRRLQPTGERPTWLKPESAADLSAAALRWQAGFPGPARVFDGLDQPWWTLLVPAARALFATWRARSRARRELAGIDAATLRDAGISPGAASFEAAQPFWQPMTALRDYPDGDRSAA